jgi:hypothetical protein
MAELPQQIDTSVSTPSSTPLPHGMLEQGNIDVNHRVPHWHDPEEKQRSGADVATIYSSTVPIGDGRWALIPTLDPSGKYLTSDGRFPKPGSEDQKALEDRAYEQYKKTGQHLGIFDSHFAADDYASATHAWLPDGTDKKVYVAPLWLSGKSNMPESKKEYEQELSRKKGKSVVPLLDSPKGAGPAPNGAGPLLHGGMPITPESRPRTVHYPEHNATVEFPGDLSHEDFQNAAHDVWNQFKEFGSGVSQALGGSGDLKTDIAGTVRGFEHPLDTVREIAHGIASIPAQQEQILDRAKEAYSAGDHVGAFGHLLNYLTPLVGPANEQAANC